MGKREKGGNHNVFYPVRDKFISEANQLDSREGSTRYHTKRFLVGQKLKTFTKDKQKDKLN